MRANEKRAGTWVTIAAVAGATLAATACQTSAHVKSPMVAALNDQRALSPSPAATPEGKAAAAEAKEQAKKGLRDRSALAAQARMALARRDHKGAEDYAKRILALDYRDREAKLILAQAAMVANRYDDARSMLQLLGGAKAGEAEALNLQGVLAWDEGDAQAAEQFFSRAVTAEAANVAARMNLGIVLIRRNALEAAEKQFRESVRLAPANPDAHRHLGITLARRGKFNEAEAEYKRIDGWQENARVLHDLALVYKRGKRLDDAIDALSRALESPKVPLSQHDSMVALLEEIRAERAARDPQNVTDVDALIAQAKKGRPSSAEDNTAQPSYFLSGIGPETGH